MVALNIFNKQFSRQSFFESFRSTYIYMETSKLIHGEFQSQYPLKVNFDFVMWINTWRGNLEKSI